VTAKLFAAVLLRLAAVWLILQSALRLLDGLLLTWANHVTTHQVHWSFFQPPPPGVAMYFHDTYFTIDPSRTGIGMATRLVAGLLIFILSKRLAGLFTRGLE